MLNISSIPCKLRGLADMNTDGKMDKKEFSIAMHLIQKKLQGFELPKALPPSLKSDPQAAVGTFGGMPPAPAVGGIGMSEILSVFVIS